VLDFSSMDYKFPYVVPLSAVLGFIASRILFKRHIETLKSVETLGSKLSGYMTGSLIKYACLEAPGFFGLFAAQASGNMAYLLITALMALIMVFERPRKEKAERDLNLNKELRIELEKAMKVNK
jgi:thiamine transporter ThiT